MVGNLSHLMSIGVVVLVSYVIVDSLGGKPIYESLLERIVQPDYGNIAGKKTVVELPVAQAVSLMNRWSGILPGLRKCS